MPSYPEAVVPLVPFAEGHCATYFRLRRPAAAFYRAAQPVLPGSVAAAYGAKRIASAGLPVKLGFVCLGGQISQADINAAFAYYGLPAPKITVIYVRGATQQPDPGGADVENMLDICCQGAAWSVATGTAADITVAIAPNDGTGIGDASYALAQAGVECASISWGSPNWSPSDRSATERAFSACLSRGMWIFPASGDNSEDDGNPSPSVDYPSGSALVWAVGGTRLEIATDGSIAAEQAWGDGRPGDPGGGGGFDPLTPKPSWQSAVPGSYRGVPDSSANADPDSGYLIVTGGRAISVGGTSGAAPLTAALFAACRSVLKGKGVPIPSYSELPALLYQAKPFHDITTGSNGLPAAPGWDAATGLGSPDVVRILAAMQGQVVQPPTGPVQPPPVVQPPAPLPCVQLSDVLAAVDAEFGAVEQAFSSYPLGRMIVPALRTANAYIDMAIETVFAKR